MIFINILNVFLCFQWTISLFFAVALDFPLIETGRLEFHLFSRNFVFYSSCMSSIFNNNLQLAKVEWKECRIRFDGAKGRKFNIFPLKIFIISNFNREKRYVHIGRLRGFRSIFVIEIAWLLYSVAPCTALSVHKYSISERGIRIFINYPNVQHS